MTTRVRLPASVLNVYCNFTSGDNLNDGLTPATAYKTLQHALDRVYTEYDFDGGNPRSQVVINLADNTTDTTGVHFSPHAFVGAQGGAAVKIKGGVNSKVITAGKSALQFYFGCVIQLENFEVGCTGSANGLDITAGAKVYMLGGMKFGACGVAHINMEDGFLYGGGAYSITGPAMYHLSNNGGRFKSNGSTINIGANLNFTTFVLCAAPCYTTFQNSAINYNGYTVTGKRFEIYNNAVVLAGGPGAYFPGNVAGSTAYGGIYLA